MISVGNDIEEVSRFSNLLTSKPDLLKKIFTDYEWNYSVKKHQARTLAGIWCAKEAVVKAVTCGTKIDIRDVHIGHHLNGAPYVASIKGVSHINKLQIKISISHTKLFASAICVYTIH